MQAMRATSTKPASRLRTMGDDRTAGASVTVDNASLSVQVSESLINVGPDGNGKLNDRNGVTVNINGTTGFGFLGVGCNANGNRELNIDSVRINRSFALQQLLAEIVLRRSPSTFLRRRLLGRPAFCACGRRSRHPPSRL